ncbi:SLAC1 family transporter [Streptomyces sp. NPDC003710]
MSAKNGTDLRSEPARHLSAPSGVVASPGSAPHHDSASRGSRSASIGLLAISLGAAGLGGAWQAAATLVSAPVQISDALFTAAGLVWVVLLGVYVRHGGARWRNLREDLRHPGQGFAFAYVPIIGMLISGHFSRFGQEGARWAYAVFLVASALVAAHLLAHWLTGALSEAALHPGYLLPVTSAPFIASATASTLHLPEVAAAAFAVGVLYWLALGAVILGGLITGSPLPPPARPTLTVLIIPPATGGIAWLAAHRGRLDGVGYGFSGIVLFTLAMVAFLLPAMSRRSFHTGLWIFSFPVAATANFLVRWTYAAEVPGREALAWALMAAASAVFLLLTGATLVHGGRHRRPGNSGHE